VFQLSLVRVECPASVDIPKIVGENSKSTVRRYQRVGVVRLVDGPDWNVSAANRVGRVAWFLFEFSVGERRSVRLVGEKSVRFCRPCA